MISNTKKRIPIMLASKVDGVRVKQKLDDIIKDELYSDNVVSNKTIKYPNYAKMIDLSIAYGLVNDIFGKKSSASKEFRQSCISGDNMYIYHSTQTGSRYINRENFNDFIQTKVVNYRGI